ncbi:hypothetical protein DL98DRAFT_458239 [Cadophora sp. DSE1049]|nr:hypothetical protein DL98DRAFT_458239 [Cadophora sp. DSE1049]
MSGIEVAGIVLAVLPLIITAVQNYYDCVEEYSHYKSALHGFRVRLSLEQSFFQDTLERLILPELSDDERAVYFSSPKWGKLPSKTTDPSSQGSSRLQWEWRKIHRSLGSKKRDKLLTRFEEYNTILGRWVENKEVLTVDKSSADNELQRKSFLDYFELVRNHACRLHSILKNGWLCSCIAPHGTNLELDQRVDHQVLVQKLPSFQAIRSTPTGSQQICSLPDTSSNKIARIKASSRSPSPANATGQPIYIDLGDLLPSQSLAASLPAFGTLSRRQRVGLAVSLASAVLQLYESPWMDELWDKRDIQFMFNRFDTERHPALSNPYVSRHFQPLQVASNIATRDSALTNSVLNRSVINKSLFALGIVLIELCLNKPFEYLRTTTSGTSLDQSPNILDDYDIANKAISDVYQEGGDDYGYVVQRCLRCEFQGQDSLKKLDVLKFRGLVYEGVLGPLVNDYKKYSLYL